MPAAIDRRFGIGVSPLILKIQGAQSAGTISAYQFTVCEISNAVVNLRTKRWMMMKGNVLMRAQKAEASDKSLLKRGFVQVGFLGYVKGIPDTPILADYRDGYVRVRLSGFMTTSCAYPFFRARRGVRDRRVFKVAGTRHSPASSSHCRAYYSY